MNRIRSLLFTLLASLIAVYALPSSADSVTKTFNATFPTAVQAGAQDIPVQVFNTTPGVATINSLKIYPAPGVTFVPPYIKPGTTQATATPQSDGSLIVNGFVGIKSTKNATFTFKANVVAPSCASTTWPTPEANAGNSLQGDIFGWNGTPGQLSSGLGCDGTLACFDPQKSDNSAAHFFDANVDGYRMGNKTGSACVTRAFDLTDYILINQNQVNIFVVNEPDVSLLYTVSFKPQWANASGLSNPIKVAWQTDGGGNPIYKTARYCLNPDADVSLGTLSQPINGSTTDAVETILVSGTPPAANSAILIDHERMLFVSNSGSTWTVKRGQGGTSAVMHATTFPDGLPKQVMRNSLPLDENSNQMPMCMVWQDVAVVPPSNCTAPAPTPTPACLKVDVQISDKGDGWVSSD